MSIQKLKKVHLIGQIKAKAEILQLLQNMGRMHLVDIASQTEPVVDRPGSPKEASGEASRRLSEKLKKSISYLEQSPIKRKQLPFHQHFEFSNFVDKILKNKKEKRGLSDQYDALIEREKTLTPWGDFQLPPNNALLGYKLWFYILPHKYKPALQELQFTWKIVHQDHHQSWVVIVSKEEPSGTILPTNRFHTGIKSLETIKGERLQTELKLEDNEVERQNLTRYLSLLKQFKAQAEDTSALAIAEKYSLDLEDVFVLQGWVPESKMQTLSSFCNKNAVALHSEDVKVEDRPPTLMDNPNLIKGGELLVNFYQTPAYSSWDPSLMLFTSFSLFFAMILSDAGYSILLLGLLLAFWGKLGKSNTGKQLRPLLATVASASLIWGVLVGSYFGRGPEEGSPLQALHILDVNDFDSMMALSIGCGILHLLIANIQQMMIGWGNMRALLHFGWVVVLLAASGVALSADASVFSSMSYGALIFGMLVVFIGGSERKVNSLPTALLRGLDGLKALTNITNMFGDVLSYLRLFALGLASASLALTFNDLADNAFTSESGFGVLFGVLILLVGHGLNLILGIVSGVVHGLRLNYIEFYKWALYGEGYPFKAFKKQGYTNE